MLAWPISGETMEQLSAVDNVFLAAESSRTPMHVTAVLIYDGAAAVDDVQPVFEQVRARLEAGLDKSVIFRRKITKAPMQYDHPYWTDDERFDLDNHVQNIVLPKPGDWQQFLSAVNRLHEQPLDMKRPLWEAHIVEGLDQVDDLQAGAFAIVIKVHHAAVDGVTMTKIIAALHTPESEEPSTPDWKPGRTPSPMSMMWNSYRNYLRRPTEFWKTVSEVVPALRDAAGAADGQPPLTQKFKTRFNTGVSQQRVFDSVELDIDRLRECRQHVPGSTINDVIVSIVGGGLRRYLQENDELADESLVAGAPINVRGSEKDDSSGNLISMMRIPLGTDIADPVERLVAVNAGSLQSKSYAKNVGLQTLTNVAQTISPQLLVLGVRAVTSQMLADVVAAPVHTMVSNVPGAPVELYLNHARLARVVGLGPLIDQVGLFHAVTSAGKSMSITFVSCPDMLPDPGHYGESLLDAYRELCEVS